MVNGSEYRLEALPSLTVGTSQVSASAPPHPNDQAQSTDEHQSSELRHTDLRYVGIAHRAHTWAYEDLEGASTEDLGNLPYTNIA